MAPAAGAPAAPVRADAEHVRAGARDRRHTRAAAGGRRPRRDHVVDHDPVVRARRAHVRATIASVSVPATASTAAPSSSAVMPARSIASSAASSSACDRGRGADRVLVARPSSPEVNRPALQVEHRGERLGRAAVDPQHEARARAAGARSAAGSARAGSGSRAESRFIARHPSRIRRARASIGPRCHDERGLPALRAGADARGCTSPSTCAPSRPTSRSGCGSATPSTSIPDGRRRGRCGARCSTPRRGRPFMHKLTHARAARTPAGRVDRRSARRATRPRGAPRARAAPAALVAARSPPRSPSCATSPASGSTARRCRARSSPAPRRPPASTASLELARARADRAARLAGNGRPQLGLRARRALDLAARHRLRGHRGCLAGRRARSPEAGRADDALGRQRRSLASTGAATASEGWPRAGLQVREGVDACELLLSGERGLRVRALRRRPSAVRRRLALRRPRQWRLGSRRARRRQLLGRLAGADDSRDRRGAATDAAHAARLRL